MRRLYQDMPSQSMMEPRLYGRRLFQRSRTYLDALLSHCGCLRQEVDFSPSEPIVLDRAMFRQLLEDELGVDPHGVEVYEVNDLPPNVRGVYFRKDGKHMVLFNQRTATTNTAIHEARHVWQIENRMLRLRPGMESDAQQYADAREYVYTGLVRR